MIDTVSRAQLNVAGVNGNKVGELFKKADIDKDSLLTLTEFSGFRGKNVAAADFAPQLCRELGIKDMKVVQAIFPDLKTDETYLIDKARHPVKTAFKSPKGFFHNLKGSFNELNLTEKTLVGAVGGLALMGVPAAFLGPVALAGGFVVGGLVGLTLGLISNRAKKKAASQVNPPAAAPAKTSVTAAPKTKTSFWKSVGNFFGKIFGKKSK